MAEWSSGTGALGRILYRDGRAVGMVDSPEIALEIVGAMRAVARLLGDEPESGRERSPCPVCGGAGMSGVPCARCGKQDDADRPCRHCGRSSHGMACPVLLEQSRGEEGRFA